MNNLEKAKFIMEATTKEAQRIAATGEKPNANEINNMKANTLGAIAFALIAIAEGQGK